MKTSNHAYSAIKLDNKWYLLDVTWGAGKIEDKKFIKKYDEFYFCTDPELFILNHFPDKEIGN